MTPLPQIMVAPNGARLSKADHPELPITKAEIIACAKACAAAGAGGFHAHIRDEAGNHLLDAAIYADLLADLNATVPEMVYQITTEAAGKYEPEIQMQVALSSGAQLVSASTREIRKAGLAAAQNFFRKCEAQNITVQHILYDRNDCDLLAETLGHARLSSSNLQIIFVLGQYGSPADAQPSNLAPFTAWMRTRDITPDWAVCAFGRRETECLLYAAQRGGKCRVGFENSLYLSNGNIAQDNAQKVADLITQLKDVGLFKGF